jgi:hypothetical protein
LNLILVVLLAVLSFGCTQNFISQKAPFIAYNRSPNNIVVKVGTREIPLAPNSEFAFVVDIQIATPRTDSWNPNGPSPADRITQVPVVWRDLWTQQTSQVWTCNAGAKITTVLVYSVSGGIQLPNCYTLQSF